MKLALDRLVAELSRGLRRSLPGVRAQRLMAPDPRPGWDPRHEARPGRPAAVLILFHPRGGPVSPGSGEPRVVLTARTATVEAHKRQVSYPGGRIEPGESPEQAALREAHEEIGLALTGLQILGRLTPLWVPATGYTIQPVVAVTPVRPRLRANPQEVARIIDARVADLLDPTIVRVAVSQGGTRWLRAPFFRLPDAKLWGASAMITAELLTLLGWPGPPPDPPPEPL